MHFALPLYACKYVVFTSMFLHAYASPTFQEYQSLKKDGLRAKNSGAYILYIANKKINKSIKTSPRKVDPWSFTSH